MELKKKMLQLLLLLLLMNHHHTFVHSRNLEEDDRDDLDKGKDNVERSQCRLDERDQRQEEHLGAA